MKPYKIIHLEQGSPEWHEFRKIHIGSSDASVIWGNPWRTEHKLWREKLGFDGPEEDNSVMRRGRELENPARQSYELLNGTIVFPRVIKSNLNDFASASLDGLTLDESLAVEIKCGDKSYEMAQKGIIPDYYMAQMQHQLFCLGHDYMHYWCFNGVDGILIKVDRDDAFIEALMKKEEVFYSCLQELTPPSLTDKDFTYRDDEEWKQLEEQYDYESRLSKASEGRLKRLREKIISISDGKPTHGSIMRVLPYPVKGRVQYDQIAELKSVDLEKYRSPTTTSYRISLID